MYIVPSIEKKRKRKDEIPEGRFASRCAYSELSREKWSLKEWRIQNYNHQFVPWTHRLYFDPPLFWTDEEKKYWVTDCLRQLRQWIRRHKGNYCEYYLYPDCSEDAPLHWHGFCRGSQAALNELRSLMQLRKRDYDCDYCLVPLDDWVPQSEYACGRHKQYRIIPVRLHDAKAIISSRGALVAPKDVMYDAWLLSWAHLKPVQTLLELDTFENWHEKTPHLDAPDEGYHFCDFSA